MSLSRDGVVAYLRQATQEEDAQLARVATEYSKVPLQFRVVWDLYKNLPEAKRKVADLIMRRSLMSIYEIMTGDKIPSSFYD